jgi:hypothetical protein
MLQRRAAAAGRVFRGRAVSDLVVRNGVVIDDGS